VGDRIAAWVTAGDDVVLAEYGLSEGDNGPEGKHLHSALESWARGLSKEDELDEGMFLSFGAGLCNREELTEEDKDQKREIQAMMETAGRREESSKRRWKSKIDSEWSDGEVHPMLIRRSVRGSDKVEWEPEEGWEGTACFIEDTQSVLVEEGGEAHSETEEKDDDPSPGFEEPGFEEWTEPLMEKILKKNSLTNLNDKEKWDFLSRHYFEITGEKLTLVVLPSKGK